MMEFKNLLWEKKDGVGIITLNREDVRNAMKAEIRAHMRQGEKTTVAFIRDWSAKGSARSIPVPAEPASEPQNYRGQPRSRPTSRTKEPT